MIRYQNVFFVGTPHETRGAAWDDPFIAQTCHRHTENMRVELRINGCWHRPPVGMASYQTSHVWATDYLADPDVTGWLPKKLERRI